MRMRTRRASIELSRRSEDLPLEGSQEKESEGEGRAEKERGRVRLETEELVILA